MPIWSTITNNFQNFIYLPFLPVTKTKATSATTTKKIANVDKKKKEQTKIPIIQCCLRTCSEA